MKTKLYLFGAIAFLSVSANAARCFYVSSAEDLVKFRDAFNSSTKIPLYVEETGKTSNYLAAYAEKVILTEDIDLKDVCNETVGSWSPIGSWNIEKESGNAFSGEFEGNNHTISNLYIKNTVNTVSQGLFGYTTGTIQNVVLKGKIESKQYVGGIVGVMSAGSINNCVNYCDIVCDGYYIGGICGKRRNAGKITKCLNYGSIVGAKFIGGLAGDYTDTLSYSANYGSVSGLSFCGGLVGNFASNVLLGCFNCGSVKDGAPLTGNQTQKKTSIATYKIGSGELGQINIEGVADMAFSSGEVAYLLNNGGNIWKQTLGVDLYPVLAGKTVYKHTLSNPDTVMYSNNEALETIYYGDGSSQQVAWWDCNEFTPADNRFMVTTNADIKGHNVVLKNEDGYSCKKFELVDGQPFYTPLDFSVETLSYSRLVSATAPIVTMALPAVLPIDYIQGNVYVFDNFDGTNVHFSSFEGTMTEANKPYVVKPDTEEEKIVADSKSVEIKSLNNGELEVVSFGNLTNFGVYEASSFNSDDNSQYIVFSSGKLKKYRKINLAPFRAGFRLDLDNNSTSATLGLVFDNDLTGVLTVENDEVTDDKVNVYDIQGRIIRANAQSTTCFVGLKKGVYLVNGQKFTVNSEIENKPTPKALKRASATIGIAE